MQFDRSKLEYRKGVNGIVIDSYSNFLLVQKQNYGDHFWDFPGGGIEDNEEVEVALLRELEEELGSDNFEIIKNSDKINRFEWDEPNIERSFKKRGVAYRGQEKYQYLVKFNGDKNYIKIQEEEIKRIKWVKLDELESCLLFDGQWENAKEVLKEFGFLNLS